MAKPTKHATLICVILSVLLAVGILLGIILKIPWIVVLLLLPAVIYQVYRTEGKSTKWASWVMLIVIILEFIFVIFKVNFNLAEFLSMEGEYVAGYYVQFGDIKTLFPTLMAVLSTILFVRTRGKYTKWLAVLIFIGAFAIVYAVDPAGFKELLGFGVRQVLDQL